MTDKKRSDIISTSPSPVMNLFRTGLLHGPAVEQELLGEGRLSRVGVRDDGEGAAPGDFLLQSIHGRGD